MRSKARFLPLVGLLLAGPLPAVAQGDPATEPTFYETVDVQIVNVDVVVTDADGNPVLGLGPEDFELLEDGKPVEITNFYAYQGGREAGSAAAPELEPVAEKARPADQRLHLMIFIDNFNLTPQGRNRLLERVKDFVEIQGRNADRFTVVSYDGDLDIDLEPTENVEEVLDALDRTMRKTAGGAMTQLELRRLIQELQSAGDFGGGTGSLGDTGAGLRQDTSEEDARAAFSAIRLYTQARYNEARRTVEHAKEFVDSLTSLDGRKALLYVSDGISLSPGAALLQAWENRFAEQAGTAGSAADILNFDTATLVRELAEYASANRVTFYTISSGDAGLSSSDAEIGLTSNNLNVRGGGRIWHAGMESIQAANQQGSLQMMAETTGGLTAHTLSAVDSMLDRMYRDLDSYYSLAYSPERQRDGKLHRIEVKVKGAGLVARHRQGYRAKTVEAEMSDRTKSALLLGEGANPLGVEIDFGRESEQEQNRYMVPVIVKIPMGRIVLLPRDEFHEGRLTIFLGARDEKGRSSPIQKTDVPIRIPNDQVVAALSQVGGYGLNVLMRSGPHRVAVTVRDELGNTQSSVASEFTPGRLRVDTGPRPATGAR